MTLLVGYGVASIGENAAYATFYLFFVFFLTNVAGLAPAVAGTISAVAVLWDAVTDPTIGHISDNLRWRFGKRRPLFLMFSVPLGIAVMLLFTNINLSGTAKVVYFLGINMFFWLFFTACDVPYIALGGELTDDFNERIRVRAYASFFMALGGFLGLAATMVVVKYFTNKLGSPDAGWQAMGALFGSLIALCYLIAWAATRGWEPTPDAAPSAAKTEHRHFLKDYLGILSLKPNRFLLAVTFVFNLGFSSINTAYPFLALYVIGLNEAQLSFTLLVYSIANSMLVPVIGWVATRLGKKETLALAILLNGGSLIAFQFLPLTLVSILVYLVFIAISQAAFWTLSYSMAFDITEVDEFKNGSRKEGTICASIGLLYKLGLAFGMWLSGALLQFIGYNAELAQQAPETLAGIKSICTLVPGIIVFGGGLIALYYPLTRERFEAVKRALAAKRAGEPFTTEGFAEIL